MEPPQDRDTLLQKSYRELQNIAKKAGVKAKGPKPELVDELLAARRAANGTITSADIPRVNDAQSFADHEVAQNQETGNSSGSALVRPLYTQGKSVSPLLLGADSKQALREESNSIRYPSAHLLSSNHAHQISGDGGSLDRSSPTNATSPPRLPLKEPLFLPSPTSSITSQTRSPPSMPGIPHSQPWSQGHIVPSRVSSSSALPFVPFHHGREPMVGQPYPPSVRPETTASLAECEEPHDGNLPSSNSQPRRMDVALLSSIWPTYSAHPVNTTSVPENPPPLLAPRGIRPVPTINQLNELADRRNSERSFAPAPETPQPNFQTVETGSGIQTELVEELSDKESTEPALDEASDQEDIATPEGDITKPLSRHDLVPYYSRPKDYWGHFDGNDPALAGAASKEILVKTVADMETIHRRLLYYSHHARQARREVKTVLKEAKVTRRLFHQERASTDRTRTFALYYRPVPDRWSVDDLWGWPMTLERMKDGELKEFDPEEASDPEDEDEETQPVPGPSVGPSRQAGAGRAGPPDVFLPEHEARASVTSTDPPTPRVPQKSSPPVKQSNPLAVSKRKAPTAFTGSSAENGHPHKRPRRGDTVCSVQYEEDADGSPMLLEFADEAYDEDSDDALDEKTVESAIFPDSDHENEDLDDERPILPDSIPLIGPGAHRRRLMRAPVYTK